MEAIESPAGMPFRAALLLLFAPLCFRGDSGETHYAGPEACSLCHKDIAASQTHTAMARTWHGAVTSLLPVSYHAVAKEGSSKPLAYEIRRQGNHFEYSTTMPDGTKAILPVKAIVGGERHGLSFLVSIDKLNGIPLERPALIEARYVYNTPHNALALSPGFPSETPRSYEIAFGRVISPTFEVKCLTCHGEPGTLGAGKQGGVRCESCHGSGFEHIQSGGKGQPGAGMINPKVLTGEQSIEICAQCHSGFAYQADPLPKELLVSNQVTALRNTECFIQSGKAVTCISCHDGHRDATRADAESVSVKVCLGCHSSRAKQRAAICPVSSGDKCIGCHMPSVDQGIFRMTDHSIRVHAEPGVTAIRHDESLRSQIPPLREFLRIIVTDARAKAETAAQRLAGGEAFFDVAHELSSDSSASAGGYLGETWLSQMRPELAAAARTLQYGETSGIVDMGNRWGILQRMSRDFKSEADQLFQQASALKLRGDIKGAIDKDKQALKVYPHFLRGLTFMGVTAGENGSVQEASQVLTLAISLYPQDSTAQFDLGLTLGALGNSAGQIQAFRRGVELDPDNGAIYESLGAALYSAGDWRGAIDVCRQGLQIDPLSAKLYFNLSIMLGQHGDTEGAERAKSLATNIDPDIARR
jgi:tetratricopeptide (TPR) repeat protein